MADAPNPPSLTDAEHEFSEASHELGRLLSHGTATAGSLKAARKRRDDAARMLDEARLAAEAAEEKQAEDQAEAERQRQVAGIRDLRDAVGRLEQASGDIRTALVDAGRANADAWQAVRDIADAAPRASVEFPALPRMQETLKARVADELSDAALAPLPHGAQPAGGLEAFASDMRLRLKQHDAQEEKEAA